MTFIPEQINIDTWPAIHRLLAPAMVRSDYTSHELIDHLLAKTAQLWVLRKGGDPIAAAVSEMERTPRGLIVHGILLAGHDMASWIDELIACITHHALQAGAIGVQIKGRRGWERQLTARGWKRKAVVMELAFEPEGVS